MAQPRRIVRGEQFLEAARTFFPTGGSVPKQTVFDLNQAASGAGCELKSNRATSREHLQDPNQKVNYPQNPPTSVRNPRL